MILIIETVTAACSAALVEGSELVDERHELVGRGHAERLVPMIEALLAGRRPEGILVDCGPGSFTGVRVGLAAAQGLRIGWGVNLSGYSSMAAIAAAAGGEIAVALEGGHGQLFVQTFGEEEMRPLDTLRSCRPWRLRPRSEPAGRRLRSGRPGRRPRLGRSDRRPSAGGGRSASADCSALASPASDLRPRPRCEADAVTGAIAIAEGGTADLGAVMRVMEDSFDPAFGEAWTTLQCAGLLPMAGVWLSLARRDEDVIGFALGRIVGNEAELLLLAVHGLRNAKVSGKGSSTALRRSPHKGAEQLHLEVRHGNHAVSSTAETAIARLAAAGIIKTDATGSFSTPLPSPNTRRYKRNLYLV